MGRLRQSTVREGSRQLVRGAAPHRASSWNAPAERHRACCGRQHDCTDCSTSESPFSVCSCTSCLLAAPRTGTNSCVHSITVRSLTEPRCLQETSSAVWRYWLTYQKNLF